MDEAELMKDSIVCGLYNMANSCYLNSVLQILVNQNKFMTALFASLPSQHSECDTLESERLKRLSLENFVRFAENMKSSEKSLKPVQLLKDIVRMNPADFSFHDQGDASELLLLYLSKWEESFRSKIFLDSCLKPFQPQKALQRHEHSMSICDINELLLRIQKCKEETSRDKGGPQDGRKNNESIINSALVSIIENKIRTMEQVRDIRKLIKPNNEKRQNLITQLFQGKSVSILTCASCRKSRLLNPEDFFILSLPIPDPCKIQASPSDDSTHVSLKDCISAYCDATATDVEGSGMVCKFCGNAQNEIVEQTRLLHLPEVLVCSFKRFSFAESWWSAKGAGKKVSTYVECPEIVDLTSFVSSVQLNAELSKCSATHSRYLYRLNAIINHHGHTLSKGHYTAYTYKDDIEKWALFNDHHIVEVGRQEVLDSEVYIAVYERINDVECASRECAQELYFANYSSTNIELMPSAELKLVKADHLPESPNAKGYLAVQALLSKIRVSVRNMNHSQLKKGPRVEENTSQNLHKCQITCNDGDTGAREWCLLNVDWVRSTEWLKYPGPIRNLPCYCCSPDDKPTNFSAGSPKRTSRSMSQIDEVFSTLYENMKISGISGVKTTPSFPAYFTGANKTCHGKTLRETYVQVPLQVYKTLQGAYGGGPELHVSDFPPVHC